MARLPLDRYLQWGASSGKSLTLNQMVRIMLEMKMHGDWERALRIVPRRKLAEYQSDKDKYRSERHSTTHDRVDSGNPERKTARDDLTPYEQRRYDEEQRMRFKNQDSFRQRQTSDRSFQSQQNFQEYPRRRNYEKPNSIRVKELFDEDQSPRSSGFDKTRSTKERKHFDKFQFDLETWGSKVKKDD